MIIPDVIREEARQMESKALEEYVLKVWKLLEGMKPGDVLIIEKVCRPENKKIFLESIKYYMRTHEYQDGLSFSNSFELLKKYELCFLKSKKLFR